MIEFEIGQTASEVITMSKQGMARPDRTHTTPRNEVPPVPEIQGNAKHSKEHARPIISGTSGPGLKTYHTEKPLSKAQFAQNNKKKDTPSPNLEDT